MAHNVDTSSLAWDTMSATACKFPVLLSDGEIFSGPELGEVSITLPTCEATQEFCANEDVPLHAIFQAVWAVALKTFTGNRNVCAASISGTGIGVFSLAIGENISVIDLLMSVQRETRDIVLRNESPILTGLPCNSAVYMSEGKKNIQWKQEFNVWLHVENRGRFLGASLFYRTEKLAPGYAEIVAATVSQILGEMLANPSRKISQVGLVHPRVFDQLRAWSSSPPASVDRCVGTMFEDAASKHPLNLAVQTSERSISYQELDALSGELALHLQSLGVVSESIVVLCFPKSVYAVIAMLAVVRAGGAILFLDPSHPEKRHQEIAEQVNSRLILTAPQYSQRWGWFDGIILPVDSVLVDSLQLGPESFAQQAISTATSSSALYIIFTSGSTGKPKGCVVEHRQFLTGSIAQQRASRMSHSDRVLQLASFTFDVSILEIFTSLITGACVCIPNDQERSKGPEACIQQFGITWAFLTPSLVKLVSPKKVPTLKFLVLGGEACQQRLSRLGHACSACDGLWATECSIAATANPKIYLRQRATLILVTPLGGCCWIVDRDDHDKLLPIGSPGELLIQGPIVARGYLNEPEKTEAAFLNSTKWMAIKPTGSSRIYKTGDLARFNFDGSISFIGRKDSQVKLRGLRIELGEIEHHLVAHELVEQAAVVLVNEGPCQGTLTAMISLKHFRQPSIGIELVDEHKFPMAKSELERIANHLSQQLPNYMHPTVWIPVRSIPLTISSKQNGVAVRQWVAAMSLDIFNLAIGRNERTETQRIHPSNSREKELQEMCRVAVGLERSEDVWLDKSFIQNGGDSIKAMQLLGTLRDKGLVVKLEDIMQCPNLLELANKIEDRDTIHDNEAQVLHEWSPFVVDKERVLQQGLQVDQVEDIYPLSAVQRGILLAQQQDPDRYQLRITCEAVSSRGAEDAHPEVDEDGGQEERRGLLIKAWRQVVQRHPVLRTIFIDTAAEDGLFDQLVLKTDDRSAVLWQCDDEDDFWQSLESYKRTDGPHEPPVAFIVASIKAERKLFCTIDISHALIDGVSVLVLLRDICQAYGGLLDISQTVDYSPFIRYLQQHPSGSSISYWTRCLLGVTPCYFPALNDDFSVKENRPRELLVEIENADAIHAFCALHNFTPATVFQAAWAITLKAYTGRDDVCFGYLTSGRDLPVPNIHNAVGVFVNMMIYRASLLADKAVSVVLKEAQDSFLSGLPHQHCSVAEIQHALCVSQPLFNTILSLQSAESEVIATVGSGNGVIFRVIAERDPTEYNISLNVFVSKKRVSLTLRHFDSTLSSVMAGNVLGTLRHVIDLLINNYYRLLGELKVMSTRDHAQIGHWNRDQWPAVNDCVHELIHTQAEIRPHANAVEAWDGHFTYKELDDISTTLAVHLADHAVGPNILVPICFPKSCWTVVSQLAVLKAGGACVAFDPEHPQSRRVEMLRQCKAIVALVSEANKPLFDELVSTVLIIDSPYMETLQRGPPGILSPVASSPDNPAFVVFTSGSTGKPKGIVVEHRALCSSIQAYGPALKYEPNARVLQFAAYTFDVSIGETFGCLARGGILCIPNDEERLNDLAGVINRLNTNVLYLTPSVISLLQPSEVPGIHTLALGGEAIRRENIELWAEHINLVNIYGPAECSVWSTALLFVPRSASPQNIGYGLGARMWIAEADDPSKLCVVGAVGELLIEGPIVARGYLNDEIRSNAVFIPPPTWLTEYDPRVVEFPTKVYRTGDLARYNSDGSLHFMGRRDHQVKLHGQRVELGEIDHTLLLYEGVQNAVALVPKAGPLKGKLVAVLSLKSRHRCSSTKGVANLEFIHDENGMNFQNEISHIRLFISSILPSYMVPSTWLMVESLPLSRNGKLDRTSVILQVDGLSGNYLGEEMSPSVHDTSLPKSKAEDTIRNIIGAVLNVPASQVSMDQSFLAIGGDSITAMQLASRCRSQGIPVSVKSVLKSRTIRQIIAEVTIGRDTPCLTKCDDLALLSPFSLLLGVSPSALDEFTKNAGYEGVVDIEDAYPCSPMQEGILISQAQAPETYKFHIICEVRCNSSTDPINVSRLRLAWARLVARHQSLRTFFVEGLSQENLYTQVVLKKYTPRVESVEDLDSLFRYPNDNPLDYSELIPPHRLTILEDRGRLYFNLEINHTLIDGASMAIILRDLGTAFDHELQPGPLYRDYIALSQNQPKEATLDFWLKYLEGIKPVFFPLLHDDHLGTKELRTVNIPISGFIMTSLQAFTRGNDITMANIFQTVWAVVLRAYTGESDVVFGYLSSGREIDGLDMENAVGAFITMLACRVRVDDSSTPLAIARSINEDFISSLPHQHTSLAEVQHALGLSGERLFNTILSLQRPMVLSSSNKHIEIEPLGGSDPTEYDLGVSITVQDAAIDIDISYWSTIMSKNQAALLASTFTTVLSTLLIKPTTELHEVDFLGDQQTEYLISLNNSLTPPDTIYDCIHSRVSRQAFLCPESPAVRSLDVSLSYFRLEELSSKLAAHLATFGVCPEQAVPLCFDKSAWAIVSMLAVLKAGGAYVSMSPSHPAQHLANIISQTHARIVLVGSQSHADKVQDLVNHVIVVDPALLLKLPEHEQGVITSASPDNAAMINFTSGSTGRPKGIVVLHKGLCSLVDHNTDMGLDNKSQVLQFSAFTFDTSNAEIFLTLCNGGCVCIPSDFDRLNDVTGSINRLGVTHAFLTPSVAGFLSPEAMPSLKMLALVGETVTADLAQRWQEKVRLINSYGPAECTIMSSFAVLCEGLQSTNIGKAHGCIFWITEPGNSERLVPAGCVGELVVEGPIVARGYVNHELTLKAFITPPRWRRDGVNGARLYKTGDLVRQMSDGSLIYIGRKDSQVKLNGQRVEMGEVEKEIINDPSVQQSVVLLPNIGPYAKKLVAVVALKNQLPTQPHVSDMILLYDDKSIRQTTTIQNRLAALLPSYMIPSVWLVCSNFPLTTSQKVNRPKILQCVESLDETYAKEEIEEVDDTEVDNSSSSLAVLKRLQEVISRVLNVPISRVSTKRSFLNLGGDSITAMQLVVMCRNEGLKISFKDVMSSSTVATMVHYMEAISNSALHQEELLDTPFGLTPIQQLYFQEISQGQTDPSANQFNQSFLLRLIPRLPIEKLRAGVDMIVEHHSMLRARFRKSHNGQWTQIITRPGDAAYRFRERSVSTKEEALSLAAGAQTQLDIQSGPVFAVELFNISGNDSLLFLVAHHLVIDLVSWRIIFQELEDHLVGNTAVSNTVPFPFQRWQKLQADYASRHLTARSSIPYSVPKANYEYWGMRNIKNIHGDSIQLAASLSPEETQLLLTNCHQAMRTEPLDIFITALLLSFTQTFNREPPAIFNEGHGRQPWTPSIDLSDSVGWFTTIFPFNLLVEPNDTPVNIVRRIKDQRKELPANGWSYFTSKYLNDDGAENFRDHMPVEILFNYLGLYQGLERADRIFELLPFNKGDVGPAVRRYSLFDINAYIVNGRANFTFSFNKKMKHIELVGDWLHNFTQCLRTLPQKLMATDFTLTRSDYPLLPVSYVALDALQAHKIPQLGLSLADIEDIYACSPLQEGMLLSQARTEGTYLYYAIMQVKLASEKPIDARRLASAWQQVVNRHTILRTIFLAGISCRPFDQAVLWKHDMQPLILVCDSSEQAVATLDDFEALTVSETAPPHRMAIATSRDGVAYFKLEISHALMDGTSMAVLVNEIAHAYTDGLPSVPAMPYSDYIAHIQSQPTEEALSFWVAYLAEATPCHFPLLLDFVESLPSIHKIDVIAPEASQMRQFCQENDITLANVVRLAWALVLSAYTGEERVCFGYLTAGRELPLPGIENSVGPFVNMLVCAVNFAEIGNTTVLYELRGLQEEYIKALPYQHASLAEIQHRLGLAGQSLFNSVVSVQRRDVNNVVLGDLQINYISGLDPTEYDLTINVTDTNHGFQIDMGYLTSRLSPGHAMNVSAALSAALFYIMSNPLAPVASVNLFDDHHNKQIQRWNATAPPSIYECIHSLFERSAKVYPDAIAIDSWDGTFTYANLDKKGTQLSNILIAMGVGPADMIPICFTKCAWAIVAMLGILKAGAAFIPIDPDHPEARLATIITQAASSLVLVCPETSKLIVGLTKNVLVVSASSTWWREETDIASTGLLASPTDVAYVLFTSGSTGTPKGVVIDHSAVSTSCIHHGQEIGCSSETRMFQFAAYTFDACILEIFTTLIYGGCICVPSEAERMNNISDAINRLGCNTAFLTPSLIRIIRPDQVPGLKTVILGGEPLDKDNIEIWATNLRLMNGYGPTETCVFCIMKTFTGRKDRHDVLGRSVGSVSWLVRPDNHEQLAPVGSVSELLVQGGTLARCYLLDETKTADAFIKNLSFHPTPDDREHSRFYKTGDLVRYNIDGSITYLGRKDTQVKLRGQRIELSEIEYQVKRILPSSFQAAVEVVMLRGEKEKTLLAAFICNSAATVVEPLFADMTPDSRKQVERLRTLLSNILPQYMQPSFYIPINRMPTTSAKKLDRKLLRDSMAVLSDAELQRYSLDDNRRPPSTNTEKELQHKWNEVLNIPMEQIRADDHFFQVGGDSISAMRLAAITSQDLRVSVADIFSYPLLSSLAAIIDTRQYCQISRSTKLEAFELLAKAGDISPILTNIANECGIPLDLIEDAYPPTPLQEGMMTHSTLNSKAYILRRVLRLNASTDIARFRMAWETVSENNPILRTRLVQTTDAGLIQVVIKGVIEWRTAESLQQYLESDTDEIVAYGAPLIRYGITGDGHFVWTVHHSLYDGWSLPLVLDQVRSTYENGLCPDTPGFSVFIKYLQDADAESTKMFWENQFGGQRPVTFPALASPSYRPAVQHAVQHRFSFPALVNSEFLKSTILRAAWALVLSRYTDSQDVVFGMTLAGRNSQVIGIEKMVGPTITTVPIRIVLPPTKTISDFLIQVQQQASEMIPYEHFGLQNISMLSPECARAIEFQNLFVIQPVFDKTASSMLACCEEVELPLKNFDSYPLVVECYVTDDTVQVEARYDNCVLSNWQVENMMHHLSYISESLSKIEYRHLRISDIDMFGQRDKEQVLRWNNAYPESVESTVPLLFAQQVEERPSALAIDAWDGQLTYTELDHLSSILARHLAYLGVAPELLVPLCFDKSCWAVVAQMSVMKAGGACVNLDPLHPQARLETIVKDSRASVILCAPQYSEILGPSTPQNEVVVTEELIRRLGNSPETDMNISHPNPGNAAYVLFTSGSTGKPKGIVIEHRSLCSSSKAHGTCWGIGPDTRLLQFAAYTFDVSCADIFTTLQRGGCICIPSEHERLNALPDAINRFCCNWAFLTPTVASLLPSNNIPSLKKLVLGGEASTWETIKKWHNVLELIICYGPAECSVYCSGARPATATSDPANLGGAIGATYWLADPNDYNRLTPLGCVGELLLEGPTVAREYLHDIEKTKHAFVNDPSWASPFTLDTPRRFYRTGDLVRYNSDGTIRFVGRKDTQVKVRGQRVELGEIEHAIRMSMNTITHATVDIILDISTGRQLVAAFLHFSNFGGSAEVMEMTETLRQQFLDLQKTLRETLPSYMIPSLYLPLTRIPLTANGKVDRRQLRDLVGSLPSADVTSYSLALDDIKIQPTTEKEFQIRDLWARALHVEADTIGTRDHFLHSGGDSIVAMRLTSLARAEGLSLSVQQIFKTPILSDMASLALAESPQANGYPDSSMNTQFSLCPELPAEDLISKVAHDVGTTPDNIVDVLPATDFQSSAIAHSMLKTRGLLNYIFLEGKGEFPWDQSFIQARWSNFIRTHQILRTVFTSHKNRFYQVILKQVSQSIAWYKTDIDINSFCAEIYKKDVESDRRLSDPLTKLMMVGNNEQHRLVIRISHAQYDGICLPMIWQSLQNSFSSQVSIREVPFTNYISTIASQRSITNSRTYWKNLLADSTMTAVVMESRPHYQNINDLHIRRSISILPQGILSSQGITFATVLKAAWAIVLASLSGKTDIIFGHVTSGRNVPGNDIERAIGPCINIIPVRAQIDPTTTANNLLRQLQSQHLASIAHESTGMRDIVRYCSPWKPYTRFSTIVQHQNIDQASVVTLGGKPYTVGDFCPPADEADIAIKTTPLNGNQLEVLLISSSQLLGEATANNFSSLLCDTIQKIYHPDRRYTLLADWIGHGQCDVLLPISRADANSHAIARDPLKLGTEKLLLAMQKDWRDALGQPGLLINWDSDFFAVGGDLVSIVLLTTMWIRQGYRVVTEQLLFDSQAAGMAQVLLQSRDY
ncbi:peptide synthetase [Microsporum canis CBS 113480]|uniref:Peptide synthetase n=1 Tax=Arthroderma otae (strain ATCC MYA-4605 / CBS 113480) TaxID=554155 RepID=C5G0G9_ARTOC|nr:peptide synthetase [Microsporum canis CBS 113480]EEQ35622.1 peptide synthetase [Microsporum canis CBS 113480]